MVAYWATRQESIDLILNEQAYLAEAWDGTGWLLSETNPKIKFVVPEEGGLGWIDTLTIPAQVDNLEAAYAWIPIGKKASGFPKVLSSDMLNNALPYILIQFRL